MNDIHDQGTVQDNGPSPIAQINISVRGLVEFILRHGDIDNRRKEASGPDVMLEGANIHRMIQKRMGPEYHSEYYLKTTIRKYEYEIVIDGRADGIIIPALWLDYCLGDENDRKLPACGSVSGGVVIDEIKTTYRELEYIKEPESVHLAQAKVYAYIFAEQKKLPAISVRMTYCNTESYETRYFDSTYTYEEIKAWFDDLISRYTRWTDFEINWKRVRNASIEAMEFPYEYREGQKELIARVYRAIEKKEKLYCMAPTGVGKTLANVYPSLKAIGLNMADKIFYLTAKTITRTVAANCLNLLREKSLKLKSVTLTAKEKICPMESSDCNPVSCPYAKGHYDRINDAMYDLLINEDDFSREKITEYSEKHKVCPFEFSLDISLFADAVICDYNYVFDPNAYLRRFFGEGAAGQYLFLVDEAHNLAERAMSMYSAEIIKEEVLEYKRMVRGASSRLARAFESVNRQLLALKRDCEKVMVVDDFEDLYNPLMRLSAEIEQFLDEHEHYENSKELLEFYFEIRHFLNIYENMNRDDYVLYTFYDDEGDFIARLMCANPAQWIKNCTDKARFTVFFSATLLPLDYYRRMLGASEKDQAVYARSIFDTDKRALLIARDVTSKYTRRTDSEYDRMAEYIHEISMAKSGNYIAFFPSFAMLERVYEMYMTRYHRDFEQEVIAQSAGMKEQERDEFIVRFSGDTKGNMPVLGFCVLGGIFSEGIDLKKEALIGAIIIGTGLPLVCTTRELLKRKYEEMGLDGFAYAYRYPGMNKVLQAAGRVIRTVDDVGVVALLDERFLKREYLTMFPREWSNYGTCRISDVGECLEQFWGIDEFV